MRPKHFLLLLAIAIAVFGAVWLYLREPAKAPVVPTEPPPQNASGTVDFIEMGNIVEGNPGMAGWTLVYEKPGAPGMTAPLEFTPDSRCTGGGKDEACVPALFGQGMRVRVEGRRSGEKVEVRAMERL